MTYQYRCRKCGRVFEVKASMAEKEAGLAPVCPACQAQNAEQVLSAFSILGGKTGTSSSAPGGGCGPLCGPGGCG